ncbi:AHH domain-containing protein [Pelomonas sp. P7]|uniref:AHH domain-containing protein n=1 Tax=Pelomonas caseinilytica TaxID=2906763 RepID=A0ABS8XQE8_9BURK|nr:RHS repeat-associated core domain-containing protein [Pelomonas sp. P7]MCE4540801.1 AHH domain-containing protein [Pelomonas sp. P7]
MQQRYYDPIAGRFLSVDPVVTDANTGAGFGLYTYVNNNPYGSIDPDGRLPTNEECHKMANCEVLVESGRGSHSNSNTSNTPLAAAHAAGIIAMPAAIAGVSSEASIATAVGADLWLSGLLRALGPAGLALAPSSLGNGSLPMGAPDLFRSDSRELGVNLMATGATRLDGDHAHHIVAAEHPLAAPARKVLAAVGMSINDPHNGMFLRAAFHQGT